MLYSKNNEFFVYQRDTDGVYQSKMIGRDRKSDIFNAIHSRLKTYKVTEEPNLTYYNDVSNSINSIMTRCPVILNMIAGRGYRDVLFVGYYDQGNQMDWMWETTSPNIVDDIPFETRNLSYCADFNLTYQFLPIIAKEYGYNINFTCVRPPESRHQGAVHYCYEKFGIKTVDSNKQYKHGTTSFTIPGHAISGEDRAYDAIIFAGVPKKYPDTTFMSAEIKGYFSAWTQNNFEIFDIYYSSEDKLRFSDRQNRLDHHPQIVKAFSTRAEWDQDIISGRPSHFQAFERNIRVF